MAWQRTADPYRAWLGDPGAPGEFSRRSLYRLLPVAARPGHLLKRFVYCASAEFPLCFPDVSGPNYDEQMDEDIVQRLRDLCLLLPEAREETTVHHPSFKVRGKPFAILAVERADGSAPGVWIKSTHDEQQALIHDDPAAFFKPPYMGPKGWVGMWLNADTDVEELAELLEEGWRMAAPKRVVRDFDESRLPVTPRDLARVFDPDLHPHVVHDFHNFQGRVWGNESGPQLVITQHAMYFHGLVNVSVPHEWRLYFLRWAVTPNEGVPVGAEKWGRDFDTSGRANNRSGGVGAASERAAQLGESAPVAHGDRRVLVDFFGRQQGGGLHVFGFAQKQVRQRNRVYAHVEKRPSG